MSTALITGGSRGLGRALATALADRGWRLILDARGADALADVVADLSARTTVVGIPGDISDPSHRHDLLDAIDAAGGRLDLLVNNASSLGPTPLPPLSETDTDAFDEVLVTNVIAPLGMFQLVAGRLALGGVVINISSDAAVEAYPGWGVYGASKAALDQVSAVLAAENPDLLIYALDPGDMRTRMHQDAFPGEDISDRPEPETVVPAILTLIDERPPSGRLRLSDLGAPAV